LLPDGSPAANVLLTLTGGGPKGGLTGQIELTGRSGADGRFTIYFDPPPAGKFWLIARLHGWGRVDWRWDRLPQETFTDIGDIALEREGSIRGRIVDTSGRPVLFEWTAVVRMDSPPLPSRYGMYAEVGTDISTGEFLFTSLPRGEAWVRAHSSLTTDWVAELHVSPDWIQSAAVHVAPGEETHIDLVYSGPDYSKRIVVSTLASRTFIFENLEAARPTLLGEGGFHRAAEELRHKEQDWVFDDLDPGIYTVRVEVPGFQPWSKSGVRPGQALKAELLGTASIKLSVVDASSSSLVEPYTASIDQYLPGRGGGSSSLRADGKLAPANGLFVGIAPGHSWIRVEAPGYSEQEIEISALAANETREIIARMSKN
jgi:hypothetical protein